MSKKILFLEDDGVLRTQTAGFLKQAGYEVEEARRIDLADKFLEESADDVGCIIADLNMDDVWLDEYQAESNGALFSGWVWLRHSVFENTDHLNLRSVPCIIYSGYNEELKATIPRTEWRKENVYFVDKGGGDYQGYSELIRIVQLVFPQ